MTDRYVHHYRILGVQRDASWKEVRKAYKSLINVWHPDRFQQMPTQRKQAEEKAKEITQCYKELAEYNKKFGALPGIAVSTETGVLKEEPPKTAPESPPQPEDKNPESAPSEITPAAPQKRRRSKTEVRTLSALGLVGALYFVWQIMPWDRSENLPGSNKQPETAVEKPMDESPNRQSPAVENTFTFGTPLGEVYAIQGVPTKTEHDVWYYGSSKVYFTKGKVLRWEESPDNPLRTSIKPWAEKMNTEFFGKGSSKAEVLAVQGAPERDGGSVWDYGVSRVYFDNDRVKGWDESPFNPLRVRK